MCIVHIKSLPSTYHGIFNFLCDIWDLFEKTNKLGIYILIWTQNINWISVPCLPQLDTCYWCVSYTNTSLDCYSLKDEGHDNDGVEIVVVNLSNQDKQSALCHWPVAMFSCLGLWRQLYLCCICMFSIEVGDHYNPPKSILYRIGLEYLPYRFNLNPQ